MAPEDPRTALRARLAAAAAQVAAERQGRTAGPQRPRPAPLDVPEADTGEAPPPATKAPARKVAAKKAPSRSTAAKKAPAKVTAAKKAPAKKAAAKRVAAKRPATSRARPEPLDVPEPDMDDAPPLEAGEDEPPTREIPAWEPVPAVAPTAAEPVVTPPPTPPAQAPFTAPPPSTAPKPDGKGGGPRSTGVIVGVVVVVALVVVGVVLAAGSLLGEDGVKYSQLNAGDCFKRPSGRFKNVNRVACNKSHDLEVYAVVTHPAGPKDPFPGMDELVRYASPLCLAQFSAYAGVPFEQLNLQDVYITPRGSAWKDGARRLVCAVGAQDEQPSSKSIKAA
jgi:hypothetical protein